MVSVYVDLEEKDTPNPGVKKEENEINIKKNTSLKFRLVRRKINIRSKF